VAALLAAAAPACAQPAGRDATFLFGDDWLKSEMAKLEALDKVTGRVSEIEVGVDRPARFGTLDIVVRACHRRPPELPPDSAAFLQIAERRYPGDPPETLFSGWMFASSPGLSALEHPVYDVIVLDCLHAPEGEEGTATAADAAQSSAGGDSASAVQSADDGAPEAPEESLDFGESSR